MIDIEFCRKSGCDYYFGGLDDCMSDDERVPKDLLKICKTSRYQVYLIGKENKKGKYEKYSKNYSYSFNKHFVFYG